MKVYLRTFGCRANHYDTEHVRAILETAGHDVVSSAAQADVAIFNSCAVTADAVSDLRQSVRRAAREQPQLCSIIMGCAPSASAAHRSACDLASLPGVTAVLPGADIAGIAAVLDLPEAAMLARPQAQSGARALLRIQDGCDEHCTFCATRLARGRNRSRAVDELVEEASRLAQHHTEIVLTGTHVGSYGLDVSASKSERRAGSLGELLEALVRRVSRVRFRISSIEATEIDDRVSELLVSSPERVCPHVHAPLQSGSDRVLQRMGRSWYSAERYAAAVERLAAQCTAFGLGADVITGFPGETSQDHSRTVELVERLPFTYLHVFPFSLRPGTAAVRISDAVPQRVAAERASELRALAAHKSSAYRVRRAGGQADVVVVRSNPAKGEGDDGQGEGEGITGDYLTVLVDARDRIRGDRFSATLTMRGERLIARPS